MTKPSLETVRSWYGRPVVDSDGAVIGTISDIYLQAETEEPVWAQVEVSEFGAGARVVPLAGASVRDDDIVVPHPRSVVVAAPFVESDEGISEEGERELDRHYGVVGHAADDAGSAASVVRSEEELEVSTRRQPRVVRMKKDVVTDYVTSTVPVRREQVRLVEEPAGAEREGTPQTTEPEVVLHAEEPVVGTRVVPKERVRLAKDTVVTEEQVSEDVRKEQVEVSSDPPRRDE